MKFGIFAPLANPFATPDYLQALGAAVEERGFDSIWVAEHVVLFDEYKSQYPYANDGRIPVRPESGILDPFAALSYLAAVTTKVRLGTGICLVPQRNPVYTAKEVATLAELTGWDLKRIRGRHSSDIEKVLGYAYGEEVIHRNNLVLL